MVFFIFSITPTPQFSYSCLENLMAGESIILVDHLDMGYGSFILMRDLNFTVNRGDIFIIMGGADAGRAPF